MSDSDDSSMETRILRAMKTTLTNVIKDTTTTPGLQHPLSDATIEDIRQCLKLISARERELGEAAGKTSHLRPHFTDEAPKGGVVVPIGKVGRGPKTPADEEE